MTLSQTWLALLHQVVANGTIIKDETGDYFELPMLPLEIIEFDVDSPLIRRGVPEENIIEMRKVFLGGGLSAFGHDYDTLIARENQMRRIVDLLRRKPSSRKATITVGMLEDTSWVPCINLMHLLIRDEKLHLHYFSRGQDLWQKFVPDVLAIREIQKKLANDLGLQDGAGVIRGVISSAHVYGRDLECVKALDQSML